MAHLANCNNCHRFIASEKNARICTVCKIGFCKECQPFTNAKICFKCNKESLDEYWSNT